jgi:hypothetical protein
MNKLEDEKYFDLFMLIEKAHLDYMLISRIIYKVKNQYRRQKQYKYIVQLRKLLGRNLFNHIDKLTKKELDGNSIIIVENSKTPLESVILIPIFDKSNLRELQELIEKTGQIIREMLKLKLYIPYSVIILSVLR